MNGKLIALLSVSVVIALFIIIPTDVYGVNTLKNVFNVTGTYPAGVDQFDVLLNNGGTIGNVSKAFSIITFEHATDNDPSASNRSWEILNNTAIRIYGHSGTPGDNDAVDFIGYVIEYTNNSDMFVQHENFTLGAAAAEGEKFNKFPFEINASSTMILGSGTDYDGVNTFYGTEEYSRYRIVNSTDWGWFVQDTPATGDNNIFAQIIDWNIDTVRVQTGNATIVSGGNKTIQITPPTVVQPNRTMFITSWDTDGALDEQSNRVSHLTFLQENGDMIFNRDSSNFNNIFEWQLIEFLDSDIFVIHNSTCTAFGTLPECDEAGAKLPNGTPTFNMPIPSVNTTTSVPFSPAMSPFGYSNSRTEGGDRGRLDWSMLTFELTSPTNLLMTRGATAADTSVGFEIVTWGNIAGGTQDLTQVITSTVNVTDTISLGIIKNLTSIANVTDFTSLGIIKNLTSIANVTDFTSLGINKNLTSIVNITDTVSTLLALNKNQTVNDPGVNITDTVSTLLALNKNQTVNDGVNATDFISLGINKNLTSIANVTDTITNFADFIEAITSIANVTDTVQLGVNKVLSDIANVTDTVSNILMVMINQTVNDPGVNVTDTVNTSASKFTIIPSSANTVNITDSVTVVNGTLVVPPPVPQGGGGTSGAGGIPSIGGTALTGLALSDGFHTLSTVVILNPFILDAQETGVLELNWDQQSAIRVTSIDVPQEFQQFVDFPDDPIDFVGRPQFTGEDFASGAIPYEVKIPALTLGVTPETNPFGSAALFQVY